MQRQVGSSLLLKAERLKGFAQALGLSSRASRHTPQEVKSNKQTRCAPGWAAGQRLARHCKEPMSQDTHVLLEHNGMLH